MANSRHKDQTLITFPMPREFLAAVEKARKGRSRSEFIRVALAEYLKEQGWQIPDSMVEPPDRSRIDPARVADDTAVYAAGIRPPPEMQSPEVPRETSGKKRVKRG